MSEILNTLGHVSQNWDKYETWEKEQDNLEYKKKEYRKQKPVSAAEKTEAAKYGRTIINAINVMDEYSEDKAEDMENATQVAQIMPMQITSMAGSAGGLFLGSKIAKGKYFMPFMLAGSTIGVIASCIPMSILSTKAQVWTSKVARFQAREQELQDPKNFVVYTQEQIEQAKKIAETIPDEKEEIDIKKFIPLGEAISTIKSVFKDKDKYEEWYKKYKEEDKQIKESYTQGVPAHLQKNTLKDQQLITNTVKKINIAAEEYSENIETTTQTAGFFAEAGIGAAVGYATNLVLNKLKINPQSFIGRNKALVSVGAAMLPMMAIATYFTSLQKDAAHVGRFKAKQEMLSDPANFVYEDNEKVKAATKDIKASEKKGFFSGITNSFSNLANTIKDVKDYNEYKKKEAKEEKKLRKALEQIPVTDEQIREAKNLQEKTFNAFEKIDEMSQKYSETVEMATDIAQQTTPLLAYLGVIGTGTGLWVLAEKKLKNLSPEKMLNMAEKTSEFFEKIGKNKIVKAVTERQFVKKLFNNTMKEADNLTKELLTDHSQDMEFALSLPKIISKLFKQPTLRNIAIGTGISAFGVIAGGLYGINSYFTGLQKKSGKIGVMKAMEELEDPRYFVDKYSSGKTESTNSAQTTIPPSYLDRLMQLKSNAA